MTQKIIIKVQSPDTTGASNKAIMPIHARMLSLSGLNNLQQLIHNSVTLTLKGSQIAATTKSVGKVDIMEFTPTHTDADNGHILNNHDEPEAFMTHGTVNNIRTDILLDIQEQNAQ